MGMILTSSQESALDLSANLSVTANAGAGKTYVLARRFVELLLRTDAKISETVAITFTEQAAGQLKKKIHDVVVGMENIPATDTALREKLRDIRVRLASAQIGTIHSFCARLLRLHPVEAGVDASFSVMEGQERERLIRESITEALEGVLGSEPGDTFHREFRSLVGMLRPAKLERYILQLFAQREQIHRFMVARAGAVTGGTRAAATETLSMILSSVVERAETIGWPVEAGRVAAAAGGKRSNDTLRLLDGWTGANGDLQKAKILHEAGKTFFTAAGEYKKTFLGRDMSEAGLPPSALLVKEFHATHAAVLGSLFDTDAGGVQEQFQAHLAALLHAYGEALGIYTARKDDLGVLDFEDLQIRTLDLLADDAVCSRIASGYRYFLVDEFQDTNDLQYSILKRLLAGFRRGNAFIVGDPKQSIYGFRNADVEVFREACDEISVSMKDGRGTSPGGRIVLSESFRPLPYIAGFVNTVFSRLLCGTGSASGTAYEDLIVAREDPDTGSVEVLLAGDGSGNGGEDPVALECASVASRIRALADGGPPGAGNRVRAFGECAVLLRDRKHLMDLERALEDAGIPYVLAGGVGYFQTQEIFDFLNYLSFLADSGDDVALAGVLRSPFFGLADDDLFLVSLEKGGPLWERLESFCKLNPAHTTVHRARRLLRDHAGLKDRIPVSRLLRTISRETGWLGTIAGLSHGPQHRENYLKLLELARVNESKGVSSLYDFVDFLSHHADAEEREGQASTAMADRAVKIMTIHAAKGLEFPVVFLPFSHRKSHPVGELLVDSRHGIGFRMESPADGKKIDPPVMLYLKLLSGEKRIAEEKRVFYVACTRAKDMLIISGREECGQGAGRQDNSPLGWLREIFGSSPLGGERGLLEAGPVLLTMARREGERLIYEKRELTLTVPVRRGSGGTPVVTGRAPEVESTPVPVLMTTSLEDHSGGDTYSATQIRTYLECPALYYFRYVLGLTALPARRGHQLRDADPDDREDAGVEGELTHRVLSELFSPRIDPEQLRLRIAALCGAGTGEPGTLASKVLGNVLSFAGSVPGRTILDSPEAKTEFQVSTHIDRSVVSGIIDRLYRGKGGLWEIVDYKTDEITPAEVARRSSSYRPQVAVYALLVHRLFRQSVVRCRLLFLKCDCNAVDFEFGEEELSGIVEQVTSVISRIRGGDFSPPSPRCAVCPDTQGVYCRTVS